jgi:predicted AAA+ superfamily ATPase
MVIENLIAALPATASPSFYRTSAGAELDLLIEFDGGQRWAIEVKRSLSPTPAKGFHLASEDVRAERRYLVYPGTETYPAGGQTTAIPLTEMLRLLRAQR